MTVDSVIAFSGFACMLCIAILVVLLSGDVDVGCHMIGAEMNKNNEVEYLMIGNCG